MTDSMEGILLIDKPILWTSHDVVDAVRRRTGLRQVGHAGTLDPMATGLLVILVGGATKAFSGFEAHEKEYEGILTLGIRTDTQDLEGRITATADPSPMDAERIRSAFRSFTGIIEQPVPRYSSARVEGYKAYELARKNVPFEPPVKTVEVKSLEMAGFHGPDVWFSAIVSKGTYIRALCEGVGLKLGCGAVLSALRRMRSGAFHVRDSVRPDDLSRMAAPQIRARLLPAAQAPAA